MEEAQACPQGAPGLLDHEHGLCPKGSPIQPSLPHTPSEIQEYTHTRPWIMYRASSLYYCGPGFLFPINSPATPPPQALPHVPRAGQAASSIGLLSPSPIPHHSTCDAALQPRVDPSSGQHCFLSAQLLRGRRRKKREAGAHSTRGRGGRCLDVVSP